MKRQSLSSASRLVSAAPLLFVLCAVQNPFAAETRPMRGPGPPDPPPSYRGAPAPITGPSVVKGRQPGIDVGGYAPDFQLETIQVYADFNKWLGAKAPKTFQDKVMLSDFVGKAPILLLFGSYT